MLRSARAVAVVAVVLSGAVALAADDDHLSLVPWKILAADEPLNAPLTLLWIPAAAHDLRRSELLQSSELTLFSSRCVAMRVVRSDDGARLASLKVEEELPAAVLVERGGAVQGRVDGKGAALPLAEVEELVRDALNRRESLAEAALDEARRRADSGETAAALAIYASLWEQRCVCPRQAKDAKRAMRKLRR